MGFIGNKPADTFHTTVKQSFTADSSTTSFTLNQSVAGENEIELFINNVRQEPGTGKAYTAAGTTLTMSEAPTTGDDMYCIFQGKAQGHHFVPNATIQGSHIHTTLTLQAKRLHYLPAHYLIQLPKQLVTPLLQHLQLQVVER